MNLKVEQIYSSVEWNQKSNGSPIKGPTDIIVKLNNGEKYLAYFFTYENIEEIRKQNRQSGRYFWAKNIILVEDCSLPSVKLVVNQMLEESDFQQAFEKI